MRQVRFTGPARRDFAAAFAWYEAEQPGLGEEFRRAVEAVLERLARRPLDAPAIDARFRRFALRRFPYLVIYEADDSRLVVHALFHTSRDPAKWQRRSGRP
jgi:plasmid stabilization system protein ParE